MRSTIMFLINSSGGCSANCRVKFSQTRTVNAQAVYQADLFLKRGDALGLGLGPDNFQRMGMKRVDDRHTVKSARPLNGFFQYFLMAKMHAIEVADGDHRVFQTQRLCLSAAFKYLHSRAQAMMTSFAVASAITVPSSLVALAPA